MYTDELLERKCSAQRALADKAEAEGEDYLHVVENEVVKLFRSKGWPLRFARREGSAIEPAHHDP